MKKAKYVLISPVRNEAEQIEGTIRSVIAQTVLPRRWVIVDDGSTDNTRQILDKYAKQYKWIHVLHRSERATRELGDVIVEIINEGLTQVANIEWDYWGKLDGDISLSVTYFEELIHRFRENPRLGIASGKTYLVSESGNVKLEWSADFHPRGAGRLYRRECWNDIGGLAPRRMWDVIDVYAAQIRGWETRSFADLKLIHHRRMDSMQGSQIQRRIDLGKNSFTVGYHPAYFAARCLRAIWDEPPYIIGGLLMFLGYVHAWLSKAPYYDAELKDFIKMTQREQLGLRRFVEYLLARKGD